MREQSILTFAVRTSPHAFLYYLSPINVEASNSCSEAEL